MTLDEFETSLEQEAPPPAAPAPLVALWRDRRGEWDAAHRIAQGCDGADGARVHAYLHRKEGDLSNAGYWYRRAGHPMPACTLQEEWRALARAFTAG